MTDDLRRAMDEAHGTGLRQAGYDAALDDLSIMLAAEVERLELQRPEDDDIDYVHGTGGGLRWALNAIKRRRAT